MPGGFWSSWQGCFSPCWPPSIAQRGWQYPNAVFPIIATILHSELLKQTDADAVESVCKNMAVAPLSPDIIDEQRFVPFLMICIRPIQKS
jgi:hypothetical protein